MNWLPISGSSFEEIFGISQYPGAKVMPDLTGLPAGGGKVLLGGIYLTPLSAGSGTEIKVAATKVATN